MSFSKEDREMTSYGYARVSTNGQDLSSQEAELIAAGCAKVFKEKVSGAKTDRAELAKVIRRLEPGDVLVVTARQAGTLNARPTQCAGHHWRAASQLPQPERHLGRYHDATRQAHAHSPRRLGRV
jgi:hypothetical protein